MNSHRHRVLRLAVRPIPVAGILAAGALAAAACGSTTTVSGSPTASSTASTSSGATVRAASVKGLGTVLVDAQGRTLYLLTTEKGGHVTCTASGGCTHIWPDVLVPSASGTPSAASGAKQGLLGTVSTPAGVEVTYNGWPLHTFSGDNAAGQAKGQGIHSFGGTWYGVNTAGAAVTSPAPSHTGVSIYGGY